MMAATKDDDKAERAFFLSGGGSWETRPAAILPSPSQMLCGTGPLTPLIPLKPSMLANLSISLQPLIEAASGEGGSDRPGNLNCSRALFRVCSSRRGVCFWPCSFSPAPPKSAELRGFDSGTILTLRGGILMATGNSPESSSRRIGECEAEDAEVAKAEAEDEAEVADDQDSGARSTDTACT